MTKDCKDCRRHFLSEIETITIGGKTRLIETSMCAFRHTGRQTAVAMRAEENLCGNDARYFLQDTRMKEEQTA